MIISSVSKIYREWKDYYFELLLIISIVFIILYALYNKLFGKKGTWSPYSYGRDILYSQPKEYSKQVKSPRKDSKGETECRRVLQKIFRRPFNKERPDFLRNPVTGNRVNLELDCYDKDLKIAVEYNGIQHYEYTPYFHKNKEAFYNQKYRDEMKRNMCSKYGIKLIEVPYTVKIHDIEGYLLKRLG